MALNVPLLIGVTGHRDLVPDEVPMLRERVRDCFTDLQQEFAGLPLNVISPLAEGADQLVAEVALEMGISVHALLPMPAALYEADFSGESLTRFHALLDRSQMIELAVPEADVNRDEQYVELAGYLAAHSHILLAIWDGEETYTPGGTSAVIHFHQHNTMSEFSSQRPLNPVDFLEDESDLVFHITCSRASGRPLQNAGETAWLTRDDVRPRTPDLPARYHQVFERLIEFNRDLQSKQPAVAEGLTRDNSRLPTRVSSVASYYAETDELAGRYQARMYLALRTGYGLALLAGLSFIIYADLFTSPIILYTYLFAMVLVLLVFRLESSRGWQRKHLDYRVLAEALRVQFYWQLAGVRMDQAYHYGHDSFHDRRDLQLGWIRHVMRYAALASDARLHEATEADVDITIESWIRDERIGQASYYQAKARQRARKNRQTERMETVGLLIVLVAALLLIVWPGELTGTNLLIAIVGLIPFGIAVRQNFAHRVAERELAAQYTYFHRIFSSADELIRRTDSVPVCQQILRALGEASLDETSQWNLRQRERPVSSSGMVG